MNEKKENFFLRFIGIANWILLAIFCAAMLTGVRNEHLLFLALLLIVIELQTIKVLLPVGKKTELEKRKVNIEISQDSALVLFEWISRFNNKPDKILEDQAEERVLFDLETILEKSLATPLSENYEELLATARNNVRDK